MDSSIIYLLWDETFRRLDMNVAGNGQGDNQIHGALNGDDKSVRRVLGASRRAADDPSPSPTAATPSPVLNPAETTVIGFGFLAIGVAIMLLVCYCCYAWWNRRRERQFMEYVNTRADSVLGDMSMVPSSFHGDDNDDREETEML